MIETILQRVTRLPLHVRWVAHLPRLGQHQSRRHGAGLEFDRLREYQEGEAVQKMNWAATARLGGSLPFINVYYETSALPVMLLVDMSGSMDFGSSRLTKKNLAAEISASVVFSALSGHDRVGMLGFSSRVMCYFPPRQHRGYQRAIPESILSHAAERAPACFEVAIAHLERSLKGRTLMFVLSDFLTDDVQGLEYALMRLRHVHDVIALVVSDPLERAFPAGCTRIFTRDLETGQIRSCSLTRRNQQHMAARDQTRQAQLAEVFQRLGIASLTVTSQSNYAEELSQLLLSRHRRTHV
jgi:uncharacterized protein (DUF58 family)